MSNSRKSKKVALVGLSLGGVLFINTAVVNALTMSSNSKQNNITKNNKIKHNYENYSVRPKTDKSYRKNEKDLKYYSKYSSDRWYSTAQYSEFFNYYMLQNLIRIDNRSISEKEIAKELEYRGYAESEIDDIIYNLKNCDNGVDSRYDIYSDENQDFSYMNKIGSTTLAEQQDDVEEENLSTKIGDITYVLAKILFIAVPVLIIVIFLKTLKSMH